MNELPAATTTKEQKAESTITRTDLQMPVASFPEDRPMLSYDEVNQMNSMMVPSDHHPAPSSLRSAFVSWT